jgi:hypothetical protein
MKIFVAGATPVAVGNVVATASLVVVPLVVLAYRRTVVARVVHADDDRGTQPARPELRAVGR